MAGEAGLDAQAIEAANHDPEVKDRLRGEVQAALERGVDPDDPLGLRDSRTSATL